MRIFVGTLIAIFCAAIAWNAGAQTPPGPAAVQGTAIVTLGTGGGPRPRADRSQSANLLIVNGTPYLIDVGENAVRRIVQAGVNFVQVGRVFITHGHSDHTAGLPALLATQWEFQRRDPVHIYGPRGTQKLVADALTFLSENSAIRSTEGFPTPIDAIVAAHDTVPGVIYRDANVTVTAVENSHFNFPAGSPAYAKYSSYAYRFDTPGRSVAFTGDTGPSDAVAQLAKNVDVLVSEIDDVDALVDLYKKNGIWAAKTPDEQRDWLRHQNEEHLSPRAVGELATKAGAKLVILTHLVPGSDPKDDDATLPGKVRQYFKGDVRVAKDLARF